MTGSIPAPPAFAHLLPATPATPLQSLIFKRHAEMSGDAAHYELFIGIELCGELKESALLASLHDVVARHEALRATFHADQAGIVTFRVHEAGTFVPEFIDLNSLPLGERRSRLNDEVARLRSPFNLERPPCFRAALIRLYPQRYILAIVAHHISCDGLSLQIILRDVAARYAQRVADASGPGASVPLPDLTFDLRQSAAREHEWVASEDRQALVQRWRDVLRGYEPIKLTESARYNGRISSADSVALDIPHQTVAAMRTAARSLGVTPFAWFAANTVAWLARRASKTDIVVDTSVSGRTERDRQDAVGCFAMTVPLRVRFTPSTTFAELAVMLRRTVFSALTAQRILIWDDVLEDINPSQLFVFRCEYIDTTRQPELLLPGVTTRPLAPTEKTTTRELHFSLVDHDEGATLVTHFRTDTYQLAVVHGWACQIAELLGYAASVPHAPAAGLQHDYFL